MTLAGSSLGPAVRLEDIRAGELLAEGGEGRVFEVPLQPHLVFKTYRSLRPRTVLDELVRWPVDGLPDRRQSARVEAAAAWPAAVVLGGEGDSEGVGLLLPRAPRRFALRHKDGTRRLASLSYLTADPGHRAVAYGLDLPAAVSPERVGLVYALARLLEAFDTGSPRVGHGDLSTKNVLWSLQRGPEIFVIDCDNSERFDLAGLPIDMGGRRRAMTPNWDDPAVESGSNPTLMADRYSLALIFLRIVGAANFPVQARQRDGGQVAIDFAVPPAAFGDEVLGPGSSVWQLCARGLSMADPAGRPSPSEWVTALESVLTAWGAGQVIASVTEAQGGWSSERVAVQTNRIAASTDAVDDVVIRPVRRAVAPAVKWQKLHASPAPSTPWLRQYSVGPGGTLIPVSPGPGVAHPRPSGQALMPQVAALMRTAVGWWMAFHRRTAQMLWTPGQRGRGARSLILCAATDLSVLVLLIFLVAMIAAPVLGV